MKILRKDNIKPKSQPENSICREPKPEDMTEANRRAQVRRTQALLMLEMDSSTVRKIIRRGFISIHKDKVAHDQRHQVEVFDHKTPGSHILNNHVV